MNNIDDIYASFINECGDAKRAAKMSKKLINVLNRAEVSVDIAGIDKLIDDAMVEAEENGFKNGVKYSFELFEELSMKN